MLGDMQLQSLEMQRKQHSKIWHDNTFYVILTLQLPPEHLDVLSRAAEITLSPFYRWRYCYWGWATILKNVPEGLSPPCVPVAGPERWLYLWPVFQPCHGSSPLKRYMQQVSRAPDKKQPSDPAMPSQHDQPNLYWMPRNTLWKTREDRST